MEEISSLDSFHTDGAESTARPESEEPPKLGEDEEEGTTENSVGKPAATSAVDEAAATADGGDGEGSGDALRNIFKDADGGGGGAGGGDDDDDLEQISDGTFEMDENSQANDEDDGTQEKPPEEEEEEGGGGGGNDDDDDSQTKPKDVEEKQDVSEENKDDVEEGGSAVNTQESTDFEEVDANLSGHGTGGMEQDESDILGESDMTLPTSGAATKEEDKQDSDKSATNPMDVDDDDEDAGGGGGEGNNEDVEMPSVSNSPHDDVKKPIDNDDADDNDNADDDHNKSLEPIEGDHDEVEDKDNSTATSRDVVDKKDDDDNDEVSEKDENAEGKNKTDKDEESKADEEQKEKDVAAEEEEDDHEDEPVENVQEPEESDVCLIPDDTETQVTDAEKEQAILARENAEKEDEEAEAAEKEKNAAAAAATDATTKDAEAATTAADTEERSEEAEKASGGDAEAQAKQAGAEAAAVDEGSNSEETPAIVEADVDADADADAVDAPDADAEPLLEEMQSATGDGGSTASKIIIAWIVSSTQECKKCGETKICGFRYKNPENTEYEYLCEQACCESLIADNPGKYFIRRKKFLIEELSNEKQTAADADESSTEKDGKEAADATEVTEAADKDAEASEAADDTATVPAAAASKPTHSCLQCKETLTCKYFFKQDQDETFYICNDDCFNLLNVEEPDKFKLKRHSIRVRNIGATTISGSSSSPLLGSSSAVVAKKSSGSAAESRVVARTTSEAEAARLERVASFTRRCADCFAEIKLGDKNLLWETMDFCNEICLGKYQRTIGSNCQTCNGEVPHQALGKYCVRFGFDIRQFCCAACLNEYKKGLKTCSCCQKDISSGSEGFLAPVGDKEQFKDFCSQACMRRYDAMCNPKKKSRNDVCSVCNNDKPVRVEIMLDSKEHNFCSNPCFSAFKFVSNIVADQCGMCCKYFERKGSESFTIYTERRAKVFCSRICLNVYIIVNRRIVSCQWCKVKKYNFDMIYKQQDAQEILMCSLNCLTLYGVSINAFSRTVAKCDNCNNSATPQYHLTMSDASMRNFCTYQCVMQFQSQFARAPLTLDNDAQSTAQPQQPTKAVTSGSASSAPFPTGLPKRVKLRANQHQPPVQIKIPTKNSSLKKSSGTTMPVISTVSSLASGETETMIGSVTVRRSRGRGRKLDSPTPPPPLAALSGGPSSTSAGRARNKKPVDYTRSPSPVSPPRTSSSKRSAGSTTEKSVSIHAETKIITVPPYPPKVRNVQTSCKPQTVTVGFQTKPSTVTIGTQTDKDYSNKILLPVPVPIYLPQPMYMYSAPFPVPVPIPLPIPVPIFVPTTRNSAQGILKEIKKIQDKMPADPFEAELLMMAEMVAEEKRASDSDSDDEIKPDPGVVSMQYGNNVQQQQQQQVAEVANNSYGEDVLQMALKMATGEYDQPTVDLESAMDANAINPSPGMVGHDDSMSHMGGHHLQQQHQQHHMMEAQRGSTRGRKRGAIAAPVSPRNNNRSPVKRQRLQEIEPVSQQTQQSMQPVEKPDANMCLKYTFGVNAWKQWVMTKNADIEKSSMRRRPFKTELLQMTADELNYSLCLFVKEVRKPNGTEYAPDTIYYLVLGIQQYLYENGRIDNIFTDPYYERFTDCLDEVARKFSVLYNDSQYIVTRVEEEHLWECKQLGAHSPHVLLSTLMFFNTKHFNLTTVEEHMQLSFSHIMKHWKRSAQNAKTQGTRNVLLRFYPPQAGLDANPRKKKVYEQQENEENPLRCPVRLYEFYLSKCPESVKTRNDVFYLQPERSCVPDSPVWYSTQALSQDSLQKMLHRVKMVKEINIALLTS